MKRKQWLIYIGLCFLSGSILGIRDYINHVISTNLLNLILEITGVISFGFAVLFVHDYIKER